MATDSPPLPPLELAPLVQVEKWAQAGEAPDVSDLTVLLDDLKARQAAIRDIVERTSRLEAHVKAWKTDVAPVPEPDHVSTAAAASTSASLQPPIQATSSISNAQKARTPTPKPPSVAASLDAGSPDASDADSVQITKPKKRKHGAIIIGASDEDLSESEPVDSQQPISKMRRLDQQQSSILESLPLPGHSRPPLERRDSSQKPIPRAISPSPAPAPARSPSGTPSGFSLKLKLSGMQPPKKPEQPIRRGPLPPGTADDFSLPTRSLVPPRPVSLPPPPLPKTQVEVTGDFDIAKPTSQTPYSTFVTSVEPYLRSFGEDDLAFLSVKSDDLSPFLIPALGRYYAEVWADEDAGIMASPQTARPQHSPLEPPPLQRYRPVDLTDDTLVTENIHLGPLSERLVASLGENGLADLVSGVPPDAVDASAGTAAPMDAVDLEERLKRELRFLGVFPSESFPSLSTSLSAGASTGEIDWSLRTDDEISTSLRACQRALRDQITINEARKAKLAELVRDRMAYQEYESTRDGLEKAIETAWIKRQRQGKPKKIKTKEPGGSAPPGSNPAKDAEPVYKTIIEPKPPMPEDVMMQLDRRRRFIDAFSTIFDGAPAGKWRGIPEKSVFEDDPLTNEQAGDEASAPVQ